MGPGFANGLGLTRRQVNDLTDFLENGIYDPAFGRYDPKSSTDSFQPNERDLSYSKYRPDLAALGARDGFMLSGLAIDDNDPLSRRDEGLEFLDDGHQLGTRIEKFKAGGDEVDNYQITNTSSNVVDTNLLIIVNGLPTGVRLANASGTTHTGVPYLRVFLPNGVLEPSQSLQQQLVFRRKAGAPEKRYTLSFLSGQGNP